MGVPLEQGGITAEEELERLGWVALFGAVDGFYRVVATDVGGDAVDGVGGEDDEFAGSERLHGAVDEGQAGLIHGHEMGSVARTPAVG